jgi:membrane protein implicated in regulation of membrane protease activity
VEPALPAEPDPRESSRPEVGTFEQGSPLHRWALARYLVGRAIGESIGRALLIVALAVLVVAGVVEWLGSTFWSVVIAVLALAVLAMRAVLRAVLRRLTAPDRLGSIEQRLQALVSDTRSDVLAELRRVGLPGRSWTLPLLAGRFLGRRRRHRTVARLRNFDVDRAVPRSRVDEIHLILRDAVGR